MATTLQWCVGRRVPELITEGQGGLCILASTMLGLEASHIATLCSYSKVSTFWENCILCGSSQSREPLLHCPQGNVHGRSYVHCATTGKCLTSLDPVRVHEPVTSIALSSDCRHLWVALGLGFIFRYEYLGALEVRSRARMPVGALRNIGMPLASDLGELVAAVDQNSHPPSSGWQGKCGENPWERSGARACSTSG